MDCETATPDNWPVRLKHEDMVGNRLNMGTMAESLPGRP